MITVLTLLQQESSRLQEFRKETAQMLAVCDRMLQSSSHAELRHHSRAYRRLADAQDEREYLHELRVRGISKRLKLQS